MWVCEGQGGVRGEKKGMSGKRNDMRGVSEVFHC